MKFIEENLKTNSDSKISMYLLDSSEEFKNVDKRPIALIFPGGAFRMVSDREAEPIAMEFLAKGYHAAIIRYNVKATDFEEILIDIKEAEEVIKDHEEKYKIDYNKLITVGFSAGGYVAAAAGTMLEKKAAAVILGYPCVTPEFISIFGIKVPDLNSFIGKTTPPMFIFTTNQDNIVPCRQSLTLVNMLNKKRVPTEFHMYEKGLHGISLANDVTSSGSPNMVNDHVATWIPTAMEWLKDTVGKYPTNGSWQEPIKWRVEQFDRYTGIEELLSNSEAMQKIYEQLPILKDIGLERFKDINLDLFSKLKPEIFSDKLDNLEKELKNIKIK